MTREDLGVYQSDRVSEWLEYIQSLHSREIEMTLDRVRAVYERLFPEGCSFRVVSVAGTNGKGSTVELLASIYKAAGKRSAKFTSPHLCRFNERFNVDGSDVEDDDLIAAFNVIENARGDVPLTFFEYGLLLALVIFTQKKVEIAILEVGLGGRLDAVNILDADLTIVTSIAMDHSDWLGDSLEKIAYEKAGIARPKTPCVVGLRDPQTSLVNHLAKIDAKPWFLGHDFDVQESDKADWCFHNGSTRIQGLPLPFGQSAEQLENAALAIQATLCLSGKVCVSVSAIHKGLSNASIMGRCQVVGRNPLIIVDVAHNEASVRRLANVIAQQAFSGRLVAVCGMLKDKEIKPSFASLFNQVDFWHFASIDSPRGSSAASLTSILKLLASENHADSGQNCIAEHRSATQAFLSAKQTLTADDCLLVFGSFFIAGDILSLLHDA